MNLNDTVLETIRMFINDGGPLALWGIVIYYLMGIIKVLAIGGVLWLLIRSIFSGALSIYKEHNSKRTSRISLVSEDLEGRLETLLSDFSTNLQAPVSKTLSDIEQTLKELRKEHATPFAAAATGTSTSKEQK